MTEWIVSNAWWFAPSLAFAGVGMLVGALLWPRRVKVNVTGAEWTDVGQSAKKASEIIAAVSRRGRHQAD